MYGSTVPYVFSDLLTDETVLLVEGATVTLLTVVLPPPLPPIDPILLGKDSEPTLNPDLKESKKLRKLIKKWRKNNL